jgi:hypothetical protein
MNYLLFELFQHKWCILLVILITIFFRKTKLKIIMPIGVVFFCLYINYYGIPHNDFHLTKYQNVRMEENLSKEDVIILNTYLNKTKKVLNSYNYPDDNHMNIRLKNENDEDEYITIYPQEGMIYKGCFLDLSYKRMMDRPFDYYIITPEFFELLILGKGL